MLSEAELDAQCDEHQLRGLTRMAQEGSSDAFIFWWKMGTGKTRLALQAFYRSHFTDCIIICRRISFDDWIDEMELLKMDFEVYADDYEFESHRKLSYSKLGKRILLMSAGDLKNLPHNFPKGQMLVVDELYLFSNPTSKRSKLLQKMSFLCSARVGLSGTIMPARDNITIFGQLMALNMHHAVARNTTEFYSRYSVKGKGKYAIVYTERKGANDEIIERIKDRVDIHMPEGKPFKQQIIKVTKTPEQATAVKSLKELYEHNNREYEYAVQIVNAVNGISNGWWVDEDGSLLSYKSTKVDRLYALLEDLISAGERVVVWCNYHNDISRISRDLDFPLLKFTGKDTFDVEKWNSGNVPIVLATIANGASVNYFKNVKYAIFFSIDYKLLNLEQAMGRNKDRKGTTHDGAHYYFLQTRGTCDARAHELVTKSKAAETTVINTLKKELFNIT